jgi:GNAT superfamily N-acetyltransferase
MVEQLVPPVSARDLDDLAALLVDTVEGGGSVSFLAPLSTDDARAFWRDTFNNADSRALFLVVREEGRIVATVQLHPAWAPNQPHRADVAKLMVHRRSRRAGHARALMSALEQRAREAGFTLLTLDTVRGDAAERLYRQSGWQSAGVIPDYALDPYGTLCDTVVFYKKLD